MGWILGMAVVLALPRSLHVRKINGRPYVNLEAWGTKWGFDLATTPKTLRLQSRWTKILFTQDERKILLNGLGLWFSFPIRSYARTLYGSVLDLESSLEPILKPPAPSPQTKVRTVVLDPGHGGKDPGARGNGLLEKELTLDVALRLRALLRSKGLHVVLTRTADTTVGLEQRARKARQVGGDLFVSLHFNAATVSSVHGVEVYALTPAGGVSTASRRVLLRRYPGNRWDRYNIILAYMVHQQLVQRLKALDRGIRRARFVVLREARMPAILVEAGFLTSPTEARKLRTSSYRQQIAQAIADGIWAYKKRIEQPH